MERELEQLHELAQQLHAQAEAGDWEAVERTGAAQRQRLQGWFAAHGLAGVTPAQQQVLEQILALNRRAERLARANQERVGAELHDLKRGRSGAAAYAANGGNP